MLHSTIHSQDGIWEPTDNAGTLKENTMLFPYADSTASPKAHLLGGDFPISAIIASRKHIKGDRVHSKCLENTWEYHHYVNLAISAHSS